MARTRTKQVQDRSVKVCYRHPTRTARRKCYACRRPICPECQIRAHGHIFCSNRCIANHVRRKRWERLQHWNRNALAGRWFRVVLYGVLLVLACVAALLSFNLHWFVPWPSFEAPSASRRRSVQVRPEFANPEWDEPGPIAISSPAAGATLTHNRISIEGSAPEEAMVGLYVNEEKVAVQLTHDGAWRFEDIPLTETVNVLQARYFDNLGGSSFSRATIVRILTAPVRRNILPPPGPQAPGISPLNLVRAPRGNRHVLLTFDGGSSANASEAILGTLREKGIQATLFLTGRFIEHYPEIVLRMARDGHVIGNHTYSHPHLTTFSFDSRHATLDGVSRAFLQNQLRKTNEAFREVTGRDLDPYWRAPFGEYNRKILTWAAEAGYRHVYWSPRMDTLDWVADTESPLYRGPEDVLRRILSMAREEPGRMDGGIVLMHLGTERPGEQSVYSILDPLIDGLIEEGYSFVNVRDVWPVEEAPTPGRSEVGTVESDSGGSEKGLAGDGGDRVA